MTTTKKTVGINGVDVEGLKQTIGKLQKQKDLGQFQFRAVNQWRSGTHNHTSMIEYHGAGDTHRHPRPFEFDNDEPLALHGDDEAPNPVEWLLHALAGCVTTTTVCHAAARGIRIESCETTLEGDIDVRGFLGLTDEVPCGYQNIRVTMKIQSDAPAEKLAQLAQLSPVFNSVTKATPVDLRVEKA